MIEVVIPAHNAGQFLRGALRSVAAQTLPPDRVTVVDDRSTDDTIDVALACAGELDGRIDLRVLANDGPRGPSAARNTAIRRSEADWIVLLDADDLLAPGHHAALSRAADAFPGAALAFADSTLFRGEQTPVASYHAVRGVEALLADEIAPGCWTPGEGLFAALLDGAVFATSACLLRREAAEAAGLFDEAMRRCEDTDFFLRLALAGRFVLSREVVAHQRVHADNAPHPRHELASRRETALSLAKLARSPNLPATHSRAVQTALSAALDHYLHDASRAGLLAYWQAMRFARSARRAGKAANPRRLPTLALFGMPRAAAPRTGPTQPAS